MNFIQDSTEPFQNPETSILAHVLYIHLLVGLGIMSLVILNLFRITNPSLYLLISWLSFIFLLVASILFLVYISRMNNLTIYSLYYGYTAVAGVAMPARIRCYFTPNLVIAALLTGVNVLVSLALERLLSSYPTNIRDIYPWIIPVVSLILCSLFLGLTILELGICLLMVAMCVLYTSFSVNNLSQLSQLPAYQDVPTHRLAILLALSFLQTFRAPRRRRY